MTNVISFPAKETEECKILSEMRKAFDVFAESLVSFSYELEVHSDGTDLTMAYGEMYAFISLDEVDFEYALHRGIEEYASLMVAEFYGRCVMSIFDL